mmetsp:Transcript_4466/g.8869  ORF Transcript_4466/g.8869 Transcript_4466/m.8869 type:complete len:259 (+) Transcript_4466:1024-1800(+)
MQAAGKKLPTKGHVRHLAQKALSALNGDISCTDEETRAHQERWERLNIHRVNRGKKRVEIESKLATLENRNGSASEIAVLREDLRRLDEYEKLLAKSDPKPRGSLSLLTNMANKNRQENSRLDRIVAQKKVKAPLETGVNPFARVEPGMTFSLPGRKEERSGGEPNIERPIVDNSKDSLHSISEPVANSDALLPQYGFRVKDYDALHQILSRISAGGSRSETMPPTIDAGAVLRSRKTSPRTGKVISLAEYQRRTQQL